MKRLIRKYKKYTVVLSIIIPTLNEEKYLPKLLECIKNQTYKDFEVIVADGNSKDKTVDIANRNKCKIIFEPKDGKGHPGKARNCGAKIARGSILLFLDADVEFENDFIEKSIREFKARKLGICRAKLSNPQDELGAGIFNFYQSLFDNSAYPRAAGFFIMTKRSLFEKVGGFDESLILAEDHNLAWRIARISKFGTLSTKFRTSMRRWKEEKIKLLFKYLSVEVRLLFHQDIRKVNFKYEFGKHQ
ncbi:MAG: glycosyltransferase [archaeon]